jgi:hypothetical protein
MIRGQIFPCLLEAAIAELQGILQELGEDISL